MNKRIGLGAVLVALALAGVTETVAGSTPAPGAVGADRPGFLAAVHAAVQGWIARPEDNICGLNDLKKLSNPSLVRYEELSDATPEVKKMRDKNIDPASPEGIQLKQAACDRVRQASDGVRGERGYCSVWKTIRHKDGREVPDITDLVKSKF